MPDGVRCLANLVLKLVEDVSVGKCLDELHGVIVLIEELAPQFMVLRVVLQPYYLQHISFPRFVGVVP